MSGKPTKKKPPESERDVRDEYDFRRGERGKYAKRLAPGSNVVVLDPDLAEQFESAEAVSRALRAYLALQQKE